MHGCCLGSDLGRNIPWGYLGQDSSDWSSIPGAVGLDSAGNPIDASGNELNPDGSIAVSAQYNTNLTNTMDQGPFLGVTAGQLQTVANGGSTGNPTTDAQLSALISSAGTAAQTVLKQIQLGQIASNTPLGNTALQAAIVGGGFSSGLSSVMSSLTSNPTLLIGAVVLGFLMLRRR